MKRLHSPLVPALVSLALVLQAGCTLPSGGSDVTDERRHLLERVDDTAIAQLYADGFEDLSLANKLLCYHLANAAIAGRDIFLDQKFAHNLAIRDVLEELFVHRAVLSVEARDEIERYTKLFWVHNGIHSAITSRKQSLHMTRPQFVAAVAGASQAGATLPSVARLSQLFDIMTHADTFASVTDKSPDAGKDPLVESHNNLYHGVTTADLEGFEEKNPLNSRLVKRPDGTLFEEVYRIGLEAEGIPPGRYATQLAVVCKHLGHAIEVAPEPTAKALRHLIRFYHTGAVDDWRAFNIAWVQDKDSVVDQINGFIEVYMDARGQKGSWEAVVSFLNPDKTGQIEALAVEAQWFEDRMPWDEEFKKASVTGITARAISVITETGDSGPITPIGINLPNEADIRENYGSKSVNLSNVVEGYELASVGGSATEFSWDDAEAARAKWTAASGDIHTNLHEVVGHASGKLRPDITNPAGPLGLYYSTLEEGRADLVGLYWIADPKLVDMGIVTDPEMALAEYESYARNALVQLRRIEKGGRIEEDHMRNRQMIVHWLIDNTAAITVQKRDDKTYYRVTSVDAFRAGCATLLAEVMRIKATGDFKAGKALVDSYGTRVDPTLHQEVLERIASLNVPSATGFVQPELRLVRGGSGDVVDVEVHYPLDIATQMLGWSGRSTVSARPASYRR